LGKDTFRLVYIFHLTATFEVEGFSKFNKTVNAPKPYRYIVPKDKKSKCWYYIHRPTALLYLAQIINAEIIRNKQMQST
jgi:hypothetical protein